MTSSLVGSEMCIRDRNKALAPVVQLQLLARDRACVAVKHATCLLYTSDAADDMQCVCRRYAVCRSRWSPYH
eukprot:2518655-Prorocentrum_lima.AAC.1